MSSPRATTLRIAVVGGGPAGSFFALHALRFAHVAGREVAITIYEGKDFRRCGQPGCNMCAGIIPASVLARFAELGLTLPPALIRSRINTYVLHTSAGSMTTQQPDPRAEIISVYRGAGPRYGHLADMVGFDELLLEEAMARGVRLRRTMVQAIRRSPSMEVVSDGEGESYDLVALATGVNGQLPSLHGLDYRPPRLGAMCQTELHLGSEEVERRLGAAVHIFLPPDDIATYGILIPKSPFVTASLLSARHHMQSLHQFLRLDEVRAVLGGAARPVCGCLPRISLSPATGMATTGFVAIGDAGTTRLYKNGIGSALATAERAAWTAIHQGVSQSAWSRHYLPLCRTIDQDNWIGRLLFLEVPILKRLGIMAGAHHRLATRTQRHPEVSQLHARILWGMFTGAYSYRELLRMALTPRLLGQWVLEGLSCLALP